MALDRHSRLIRDLKLVRKHDGLTDEYLSRVDSFYALLELSDDEYIELTTKESAETAETE